MRRKLKQLDLKLTELAKYMDISRPTLYKNLNSYIEKDYEDIKENILNLLRFIDRQDVVSKRQVISFILTNSDDRPKSKDSQHDIDSMLDELRDMVTYPKFEIIERVIKLDENSVKLLKTYLEFINSQGGGK